MGARGAPRHESTHHRTPGRVSDFGHVAIGLAPAETAGFLKSESVRYKSIVELGGIKPE